MDDIQFKHVTPVQIRFSDVDQFGHVNNSVYFSLYDLAKTSYFRDVMGEEDWSKFGIVVANINANFLAPVFFRDEIAIETSITRIGNKSFELSQRAVSQSTGEVKCECTTIMVTFDVEAQTPIPMPMHYREAISKFEGRSLEELSAKR